MGTTRVISIANPWCVTVTNIDSASRRRITRNGHEPEERALKRFWDALLLERRSLRPERLTLQLHFWGQPRDSQNHGYVDINSNAALGCRSRTLLQRSATPACVDNAACIVHVTTVPV